MDIREELIVELTNVYRENMDISDIKMRLSIILSDYEISKRKTEIVLYEEDATVLTINKFLAAKLASGRTERTVRTTRPLSAVTVTE